MYSVKITKNLYGYKFSCHDSLFEKPMTRDGHVPMPKDILEQSALNRARKLIRDYAFNNSWTHFITITISSTKFNRYKDKDKFVKRLLKYFDNYRQMIDSTFRYLLVPEFHDDGAVHFHGYVIMSDSKYLKFLYYDHKKRRALYTHIKILKTFGICQFVRISSNTLSSANYITKYMVKGFQKIFSRYYFASKGLKRSEVVYSGFYASNGIDHVVKKLPLKIYHSDYGFSFYITSALMDDFIKLLDDDCWETGVARQPFLFFIPEKEPLT